MEFPFPLTLFLKWIRGNATGSHDVAIRIVKPDGTDATLHSAKLVFEEAANVEWILGLQLKVNPGTYWFAIVVDDEEVTRAPLSVNVSLVRQSEGV